MLESALFVLVSCGFSLYGRCFLYELELYGIVVYLASLVCFFFVY